MLVRSTVVWGMILLCAVLNGMLRDAVLAPRLGETFARAVSSIVLSAVVLVVTFFTVSWMDPRHATDALRIGVVWLALTLTFELAGGYFLFHKPWAVLLADYNIMNGRLWVLVLVTTLLAPALIVWLAQATPGGR
jgi:hypothetical protein